jgi:tripartite-type tricarboxylate transporter receptor subunit TctC
MNFARREFLQLAGAGALAPALPQLAFALDYPVKSVRWIIGFAPGGSNDLVARIIGQWLSERFGQQFIIENRPGASGNIATQIVVNAIPDGYTMLLVGAPSAINATLYERLNFVFLRDIAPVAGIVRLPLVMEVAPSFPATTVPEFIAYAKSNPGRVNFASAGSGAPDHMSGELFKIMAGIDMVHVPYRGGALALADLLGGQVQVLFGGLPAAIEYIKAGKLRALAVTTATRSEVQPNIPSLSEFLPGYETSIWYGVGVPRSTPTEIVDRLNKEINLALTDPAIKSRFANLGGTVLSGSPGDFGRLIADETEKWAKVVKTSGAKPD